MAGLNCPGFNKDVATGTAWDFASETGLNDTLAKAQSNADAKAVAKAMEAFAANQCPPPCISFPFVRFGKRSATPVKTAPEADFKLVLAATEWFLDVVCVDPTGTAQHAHQGHTAQQLIDLLKPKAAGPPDLKKGDWIDDRWVVLHLCDTEATEDPRSGEIKMLHVTCKGSCEKGGGQCQVLSCPRESLFGRKPEWSLVPKSEGVVTIRRQVNQPFDYYQCACLAELP